MLFLSGNNFFNQKHSAGNKSSLFTFPCEFPTSGIVVNVLISWSNLVVVTEQNGVNTLSIHGFHSKSLTSGADEAGTTAEVGDKRLDAIRDAGLSWNRLYILDKTGRCSSWIIGKEGSEKCYHDLTFARVAAGEQQVIGLTENGQIYHIDDNSPSFVPREIDLSVEVKEISCGKEHTLILARNGQVYSFGGGSRAQLGHGELNIEPVKTPKLLEALEGIAIKQVDAGGWHSAAVSEDGDLYIWGWNESGQLGFPSKSSDGRTRADHVTFLPAPSLLEIADEVVTMAGCGSRHTAALTESGIVYTWGWNRYSQLGHGDTKTLDSPTQVTYFRDSNLRVKAVFCGAWNTCFVTEEGSVT